MPIRYSQDNEIIISMTSMMSLAARLAGVPLSTIKSLPLSDIMRIVGVISGFLGGAEVSIGQDEPASSSEPLTLPGSIERTLPVSLRSA